MFKMPMFWCGCDTASTAVACLLYGPSLLLAHTCHTHTCLALRAAHAHALAQLEVLDQRTNLLTAAGDTLSRVRAAAAGMAAGAGTGAAPYHAATNTTPGAAEGGRAPSYDADVNSGASQQQQHTVAGAMSAGM